MDARQQAPDTISTHDITTGVGISVATLRRWTRRRLLPRPRLALAPSGRGRRGVWPREVLTQASRVRQLQLRGYSLDEIAQRLGERAVNSAA